MRLYNATGHNLLADRFQHPMTNWIAFSLKELLTAPQLAKQGMKRARLLICATITVS